MVNGKLKVLVLKSSIEDPNKRHLTDEQGEAEFVVDACLQCKTITIQVLIVAFCYYNLNYSL